jgi:hypothetical protein
MIDFLKVFSRISGRSRKKEVTVYSKSRERNADQIALVCQCFYLRVETHPHLKAKTNVSHVRKELKRFDMICKAGKNKVRMEEGLLLAP